MNQYHILFVLIGTFHFVYTPVPELGKKNIDTGPKFVFTKICYNTKNISEEKHKLPLSAFIPKKLASLGILPRCEFF